MTFQIHIKIVKWRQPVNTVELWVAAENQPSVLTTSVADVAFRNNAPDKTAFGKVWLLSFMTAKDPSQVHVPVSTWYDELIISRSRIPDPGQLTGQLIEKRS